MAPKKIPFDPKQPTLTQFFGKTAPPPPPPSGVAAFPARQHSFDTPLRKASRLESGTAESAQSSSKPWGDRALARPPCKYFASGMCRDGVECRYAHLPSAEVGAPVRVSMPQSASASSGDTRALCPYFARPVGCKRGNACPLRHYNDFGFGVVRVPWSQQYTFTSEMGTECQWWQLTSELLRDAIHNMSDLQEVLIMLLPPPMRAGCYSFATLTTCVNELLSEAERAEFFGRVLPWMQRLVLECPRLFPEGIQLLRQRVESVTRLTQLQCCALLACAFFNLFPGRHSRSGVDQYMGDDSLLKYANNLGFFNFAALFSTTTASAAEKVRCLLHYFREMCADSDRIAVAPPMFIEFARCVGAAKKFDTCTEPLAAVTALPTGVIEDDAGHMQIDFANKVLGGGVLTAGCVQEEIRFVICPELLVSRLIAEILNSNEAVIINGSAQFSQYSGYAGTFKFAGNCPRPPLTATEKAVQVRNVCVAAMDAAKYGRNAGTQFLASNISRDTHKAFVTFEGCTTLLKASAEGPIATGNWGCGAFGGDLQLKFLIQLCAASAARRPLHYYTFGNEGLAAQITAVHAHLVAKGCTVDMLFAAMISFNTKRERFAPAVVDQADTSGTVDESETLDDAAEAALLAQRTGSLREQLTIFEHIRGEFC